MKRSFTHILFLSGIFTSCTAKPFSMSYAGPYKSLYDIAKTFTVFDNEHIEHTILKLSKQEFENFKSKGLELNKELSTSEYLKAYNIDSGKVIIQEHDRYALYPSAKVVADALAASKKRPSSEFYLYKRNPYGKNFVEQVPLLIKDMLTDFSITTEGKTSLQVLAEVDKFIVNKRNVAFFNKYFLSFIAIVGHYAAIEYGASWKILLLKDNETWSPHLSLNNKDIFFLEYIEQDVCNLYQETPLTEVFETILAIGRFGSGKILTINENILTAPPESSDKKEELRMLSSSEFDAYKKEILKTDSVISNDYVIKLHQLNNKKILIETEGRFFFCASEEACKKMIADYENSTKHIETNITEEEEEVSYYSMLYKEKFFMMEDSQRKQHEIPSLTKEQWTRYQQEGVTINEELSDPGLTVYETAGGEIIAESIMIYRLYPSKSLYIDIKNNQKTSIPIFYGVNHYKDHFPNEVNTVISSLLHEFTISTTDKTEKQILLELDEIIDQKRTVAFFNQHYLAFTAIVGQYAIQVGKGHWKMKLANDNKTWVPAVVINNKEVNFVDYIMTDVYNLKNKQPLTEIFETILSIANFTIR